MDPDFKIVNYDDFARRWYKEHPDDEYLPPLIGGPIDEMFVAHERRKEKYRRVFYNNISEPVLATPMDTSNSDVPRNT